MEEVSQTSLMSHFHSKKNPLLTTPIKKSSIVVRPDIVTPERSNPNPSVRTRNQNRALSISDIRRKALQLQKSDTVQLDSLNKGPEKLFGFGVSEKPKGPEKSTSDLPEKHQMLCDFFVAMVNSMRLLRLKRVPATLTKLARNIESLTNRRFTLHHLAQLKYIVPEVIMARKIRTQDEKTKCMQEDLLLSIEMDAVQTDKNAKGGDGFNQLKKIFRSRVIDFSKTHLEDDDIPEGELPHLFHQPKQEPESNSNKTTTPLVASLVAPTFKRRFSSKPLVGQVSESSPVKQSTSLSGIQIKEAASSEANDESSCSTVKAEESLVCPFSTPAMLASTPSKPASTPARLMSATPTLRTPKRKRMASDHDACELTNKSAKRRALKFNEGNIKDQLSSVDEEENILPSKGSVIAKDDVLALLPDNLLESLIAKEKKIMKEKDPIVSQARRRQRMMAGVPKLFDMIQLLFQSIRRNVITKEELIYKILSGHIDIIDRIEVEEQLNLLQELAPECISEQISLCGDTLVSINKHSSADSIRTKLLEARLDK